MALARRTVRYVLVGAAVLAVVLVIALYVLTRTEFGVEQSGRFVLDRLRQSVNGEVEVERITSGGLLRGVTLEGLRIADPEGRPFLRADSAHLSYHIRTLLGGDLAFSRLTLYRPEVYLELLPGREDWNYQRIFPADTMPRDTVPEEDLILIERATIHDGLIVMRTPWEPGGPVEPADTARLILEEVPGGVVRTVRFEDVNGRIPRIAWQTPEEEGSLIQVAGLSTRAYIWEDPAEVRGLEGTLTIRDSLYSFQARRLQLPDSRLSATGRFILEEDRNLYDIEIDGDDVAFRDFQWLYPRLPQEGGGALRLRIQTQDDGALLWLARDARLRSGGTEVAGSFGVVTGDTLYFANVDLRASPLDLELLQTLLPVDLPLEGLLVGTVEVEGPISALTTRGDLRYRAPVGGRARESWVRWAGTVRGTAPYAVRGFEADLRGLDLEHLAGLLPGLALDGVASGRVRADGPLSEALSITGDLALDHRGVRSSVRGGGRFALAGGGRGIDLRLDAEALSLDLLAHRFPALGRLTGVARGPVVVSGTMDQLQIDADITTPAGGVILTGRFDLLAEEPTYRAQGAVTDFRLDRVVEGLVETTLTGRFGVEGRGVEPETLAGSLHLDVLQGQVAAVELRESRIRARAAGGLITVDTLAVESGIGTLAGGGTFGLGAGRAGQLRLEAAFDSLSLLEPTVFPELTRIDTAAVLIRRLAGQGTASVLVDGGLADPGRVRVRGDLDARNAVWADLGAAHARLTGDWARAGLLELRASADSLTLSHRFLPQLELHARWLDPEADVTLQARTPDDQTLRVDGVLGRTADGGRFDLRALELTGRDGVWALAERAAGRFGRRGISLDPLLLTRQSDGARIRLSGQLPWREVDETERRDAAFVAELRNVRLGEMLRVAQLDSLVDGLVNADLSVRGTALAPVVEGSLAARSVRIGDALVDSARARVSYRDSTLTGAVTGWRGQSDVLRGEAAIPLDLAFADRAERRLDRPLTVEIRADSVPASLLSFLTPGFHDLAGQVHGVLAVAGTTLDPTWRGELRVEDGAGSFEHSGIRYRAVEATARISEDALLRVEGRFRTANGTGDVQGTLDLTEPRDPLFDLDLVARRLDLARRRDVAAMADGRVHLGGRYTRPVLTGRIQVLRGEMNLAEILRQNQIVQLDPWLFEVFDTASIEFRPPPQSPFVRNLSVADATVTVARDFWLRSPELNVEVGGDLRIAYHPSAQRASTEDLRLTGSLQALRGTYELQVVQSVAGRRFDIRSGTVEFPGTPGMNPDLDIRAQYRVRRRQGDPIDVVAVVTGQLESPRVRFTSDSDPPMSEADLASYLLFGRSTLELTQAESDIVSRGLGFVRPVLSGTLSAQLQHVASSLGIGVDYLALSVPEYGLGEYGENFSQGGWAGVFQETQVDVGFYARPELFLVGSVRFGSKYGLFNRWGGRAEWRVWPGTWEVFVEDRFARMPSFGLEEIENRTVWGLSLYREWGY